MKEITYLGSFDDRIENYLDYGRLDVKTLNEILISELIFSTNSQIVINDGYLVNSPILKGALFPNKKSTAADSVYFKNSPLFTLIKNGYVSVLSREGSLVGMVKKMVEQDNRSFLEVLKDDAWEVNLSTLDKDLSGNFIKWPKFNISIGFNNLMKELLNQKPKELNLKVSDDEFKEIGDRYLEEIVANYESPRNKWELILGNSKFKAELMHIANVAYHYNFGLCLQADSYKECNVFVNTLNNNLFEQKQVNVLDTEADLTKLNFEIPSGVMINDEIISALKTKGDLNSIHTEFVLANRKYINGDINDIDLKKVQHEFRNQLISFDRKNFPIKTNEFVSNAITLTMASVGAAIGCSFVGPMAAFITTFAGGAVGSVGAKAVDLSRTLVKYKKEKYNLGLDKRTARFSSYQILNSQSESHTKRLSLF